MACHLIRKSNAKSSSAMVSRCPQHSTITCFLDLKAGVLDAESDGNGEGMYRDNVDIFINNGKFTSSLHIICLCGPLLVTIAILQSLPGHIETLDDASTFHRQAEAWATVIEA